ncbi:GNAT family N-acetyltransferase [Pseudoalteromonas sp. MMG013]|uniref:GNAT family N-acetyltransferase n=1 Tax=Pseudoalteromonas sp. MMG013 TaxID=2822687 RepID=UPI001B360953|nr:GNAT family N-acetyltransferase [Pseudoalteromonas sp. MMG013]MBQ4861916.1 GNAT family N-acetyltransferase [Pseudoalteromonas sp. MMG013]
MQWHIKRFSELDTITLFQIMKARVDVFVVEQACPYPELDDIDHHLDTYHIYAQQDGVITAYARTYRKGIRTCAIGRVLVHEKHRGVGLASQLMSRTIELASTYKEAIDIFLSAQTQLLSFYQGLGFHAIGKSYLEDGIAHQDMVLKHK